ncbi:MFS sugar transporter-like protein [Amylocarpus encephaloides]|uniref:MFS sugar transporter-like protein n=1 Tax=Amylocarpus encephaloides TaxID=45428 RepID=A0A9P7YRI9_9HELO|nr:MFS sugar transporter-like protein [Amylocarpus encephaloides]
MVEMRCHDSESEEFTKPLLENWRQKTGLHNTPNFGTMTMNKNHDYDHLEDSEDDRPRHLNQWRLLCLTISMGGLQTIWTSIMSQGSPYLASLGMSPSLISLVWLSGPLSGMFIQPCIGVLSDSCTHPLGRRKTFIVFGTIATSVFMISLPWTENIVQLLFTCFDRDPAGRTAVASTQFIAAMIIWALKISLQPVQCGIRALIVDYCPPDQQHQASAYASRAIGIGSIFGYASGFVDVPSLFPFLGHTQFQGLCIICCAILDSTVVLQCMVIPEKRLNRAMGVQLRGELGAFSPMRQVITTMDTMPERVRKICIVQFFAWLGWFSFMYYITTYIGDLYRQESPEFLKFSNIDATRFGTVSMLSFATTAFITNLILPRFVKLETASSSNSLLSLHRGKSRAFNLTLPRAWVIAHILAGVSFFLLGLTKSRNMSILLVAVLGISWALTQWAPFALIGEELAKHRGESRRSASQLRKRDPEIEKTKSNSSDDNSQTALVLGLHNLAISAPQIVAAVGSSMLFWGLGMFGITGTDAIGWLLMFGVIPGFAAAWWAWAVEKQD